MLRCWIFHVDNGVGTCEVPAELTTSNWRDVDGDFYSGMTVTITTDLGKGGWQLDKQSTSGWKGSKLVLGCGRKGLNGEGSTVYLVNLQEITAKGEAYDHYVYKTDDGFLKVKRHGGTVGSMDWTLEPVPATGGDDLEDATFIPIAGTGYCRVEDGAGAQHHTPWGTVDGTSDDDCKKQCGDDADCIAVTWDPEQKQCELMCDKPTGICSNACGWTVGHPNFDGALPDSASNIQFVDTGACFQSAGKLTGASFTAGRAEQDGKKFQVYRLQSGQAYTLVGETEEIAVTTVGLTHATFERPLAVQAGDCIGWRHDGAGVVKFSQVGSEVRWLYGDSAGVGNTMDFNGHGARTYAYSMDFVSDTCTDETGKGDADSARCFNAVDSRDTHSTCFVKESACNIKFASGWIANGDDEVMLINEPMGFDHANSVCSSRDATLVSVPSDATNTFLGTDMMSVVKPWTDVWIGATVDDDAQLRWVDGSDPGAKLDAFATGENVLPQQCVVMKTDGSGDWAWDSCDARHVFFCERSLCHGDFSPSLEAPGVRYDGPVPLVDGVKIWYDRDYVLADVPEVLVGASLFQGPHKSIPKGTEIKIHTDGPTTIYVFFEHEGNMRNGGYHLNLGKRGFAPAGVDPSWQYTADTKYKMLMYEYKSSGGDLMLPPTQTDQTVMCVAMKKICADGCAAAEFLGTEESYMEFDHADEALGKMTLEVWVYAWV